MRNFGQVDSMGPVFISYRDHDGHERATHLARSLRAIGLPVWQAETDLPPGDNRTRLREALNGGLSAAVIVITPDIGNSRWVRKVELPKLLRLARDRSFTLAIANAIPASDREGPDRKAPDRLLTSWWRFRPLGKMHQHAYIEIVLGRGHCQGACIAPHDLDPRNGSTISDDRSPNARQSAWSVAPARRIGGTHAAT